MSAFRNKNRTSPFISYKTLLSVCLLLTAALLMLSTQLTATTQKLDSLSARTFRSQFAEGKACGIITSKFAAELIGEDVVTTGSIIASDAPTAASRTGSPRVDGCAHTSPKNGGSYVDLVIKTYESVTVAQDAYTELVGKVIFVVEKDNAGYGQKLNYSSGVYYLLKEDTIIELSAGRADNLSTGQSEEFSKKILTLVTTKL